MVAERDAKHSSQAAYNEMQNAKEAMEDYVPPSVNVNEVLVDYIGYTYDSSTGIIIYHQREVLCAQGKKHVRLIYLN